MRRRPALRPAGLAGTAVAHGVLAAVLLVAAQRATSPPALVYAVELIAAPLPENSPRRAPNEAPPVADDDVAPVVKPRTETPRPVPPPPPQDVPPRTERQLPTRTPVTPLPGETPSSGQDVANVKISGFEDRYAGYVRNIVTQIRNRWQRPMGNAALTAEIAFVILKDGSVRDIEIVKRSGNYAFDLGARGAIESAGEARAFGPLPTTFEGEALPISFFFTPSGGRP
jgi:outer membrane biosynthesis protein TonB